MFVMALANEMAQIDMYQLMENSLVSLILSISITKGIFIMAQNNKSKHNTKLQKKKNLQVEDCMEVKKSQCNRKATMIYELISEPMKHNE
jgi:site-specific DNA-adenine methylase